jgi:hypothetical protein
MVLIQRRLLLCATAELERLAADPSEAAVSAGDASGIASISPILARTRSAVLRNRAVTVARRRSGLASPMLAYLAPD